MPPLLTPPLPIMPLPSVTAACGLPLTETLARKVTIPLTNVANAQTINVTLNSVNTSTNVVIPMSILIGDTNASGTVNAADVAQTKAWLGQTLDATNFRSDINANGSINAADTAIVKQNSGTSLPSP